MRNSDFPGRFEVLIDVSGPSKGVIGEFGRPMNPMDSAISSVEFEITMGASIVTYQFQY